MSRRRFRIGVHEIYDRRFDSRKSGSQILNPMGNQVSWAVFEMADEHGVTALLADYKTKLKRAESAVGACDVQFKQSRVMRANAGRAVPKERDDKTQAAYMDSLAALDVTGEEVDRLEALLKKFTEKRVAVEASKVLRYGPVGTGKNGPDNVLAVLDGQTLNFNADGILVIADARSPYNGMAVVDYRKYVVLPWIAVHRRICAADRASLPPWPACVARPKQAPTDESL